MHYAELMLSMRNSLVFIRLSNCIRRSVLLSMIFTLLLVGSVSCVAPVSDPALETVRQALQNDDQDPEGAFIAVRDNLNKVKDRQIVPLLLDYLNKDRRRLTGYPAILDKVTSYLEQISGVSSHIVFILGDAVYMNGLDADKDIEQWQAWWDANKDYIYWDEQAKILKVRSH